MCARLPARHVGLVWMLCAAAVAEGCSSPAAPDRVRVFAGPISDESVERELSVSGVVLDGAAPGERHVVVPRGRSVLVVVGPGWTGGSSVVVPVPFTLTASPEPQL
jgi:hypothetical protein